MTSKLARSTGLTPDFRLAPEVGSVPEAKELVDPLPEHTGGGRVGPPGPGREQSAADPKNR